MLIPDKNMVFKAINEKYKCLLSNVVRKKSCITG